MRDSVVQHVYSGVVLRDLREKLLAGSVSLQLVDVLHEDSLVLEHVAFGPQVQAVVPAHDTFT